MAEGDPVLVGNSLRFPDYENFEFGPTYALGVALPLDQQPDGMTAHETMVSGHRCKAYLRWSHVSLTVHASVEWTEESSDPDCGIADFQFKAPLDVGAPEPDWYAPVVAILHAALDAHIDKGMGK